MPVTVEIEYKSSDDGKTISDDEISRVFVVIETSDVVILSLETETKYPKPDVYWSSGFSFVTKKGNVASVKVGNLPSFKNCIQIAEASRYGMFFVLFKEPEPETYRQIYDNKAV